MHLTELLALKLFASIFGLYFFDFFPDVSVHLLAKFFLEDAQDEGFQLRRLELIVLDLVDDTLQDSLVFRF